MIGGADKRGYPGGSLGYDRLMLHLYEYEGCPFCARVRAALGLLALDAVVLPCPRRGRRFRPRVERLGGRQQFPLLIDTAAAVVLYESADIVAYLRRCAGSGPVAAVGEAGRCVGTEVGAVGGGLPELFSDEASPACRVVRALLSDAERPYVLRNPAVWPAAVQLPAWLRDRQPPAGPPAPPVWVEAGAGLALYDFDQITRHLQEGGSAGG